MEWQSRARGRGPWRGVGVALALIGACLLMPGVARACITADNPEWTPDLQPQRLVIGRVVGRQVERGDWTVEVESFLVGEISSPFTLHANGNCSFESVAASLDVGDRLLAFEYSKSAADWRPVAMGTWGTIVWQIDEEGRVIGWPSGEGQQGPFTVTDVIAGVPDTAMIAGPESRFALMILAALLIVGAGVTHRAAQQPTPYESTEG